MPVSAAPADHAIAALKQLLGARANDTAAVREHHSHGESYHAPAAPDVVCFPAYHRRGRGVLDDQRDASAPGVPFGAGTSLEGHVNAIRGGISIDLREMNRDRAHQRRGSRRDRRSRA